MNKKIPIKLINKFKKTINNARLESSTIKEFFDIYSKTLNDMFNVELNIFDLPYNIRDVDSSSKSPIGKRRSWGSEAKADPNIPNTYRAYTGSISAEIKNYGKYDTSESFQGTRLFWAFGELHLNWMNGGIGTSNKTDQGETFDLDLCLFLEDFPKIYEKVRLETNLNELNNILESGLNDYKRQIDDNYQELIDEDLVLKDLDKMDDEIKLLQSNLRDKRTKRQNYLRNENNKIEIPMPEITSEYLNLGRYHNLVETNKITDVVTPKYATLYNNLKLAQDKFDIYYQEHIEDFL